MIINHPSIYIICRPIKSHNNNSNKLDLTHNNNNKQDSTHNNNHHDYRSRWLNPSPPLKAVSSRNGSRNNVYQSRPYIYS